MDARFRELDPRVEKVHRPLAAATEGLERATRDFLRIPDSALERDWSWIGGSESDVRSGFYIALQAIQRATGAIDATARTDGQAGSPGRGSIAATAAARWDLDGLLAPLADEVLDADPGGGEWTVRQTLAHTLYVQRAYPYFSAWWITQKDAADYPQYAPDTIDQDLPSEEANGSGSVADIRSRLEALFDLSAELWRDATADDLDVRARWSGFAVPVGFRLGRWAPHIEEHTLQVDKTLAMLGRQPTEVERLVRLLHRGMGQLEAAVWMLPDSAIAGCAAPISAASDEVERIASEVSVVASEVSAAST